MEQTIPVVDLNDYRSGDDARRQQFVDTVGEAMRDLGFFALENHGVSSDIVDRAYEVAETFFRLDDDTKKQYKLEGMGGQRGYTSFGEEHAKDASAPDLKEFWHVGRILPEGHELEGPAYPPNVWPDEVKDFKAIMSQLYTELDSCALELLEACALSSGLPKDTFSKRAENGQSVLRVIHYPPIPDDADPASIRAAAHEDINFITLLPEATAGGLELLQHDGNWRPIHALEGQIIVDAGDMLQHLTNGLLKSTTHRVVNPDNSRERRFSMPFFVHPRPDADLTPLQECIDRTSGEAEYPSRTAGEFLEERLREIGLKE
jgi:isopenicillin N synthase-like dioxygenase